MLPSLIFFTSTIRTNDLELYAPAVQQFYWISYLRFQLDIFAPATNVLFFKDPVTTVFLSLPALCAVECLHPDLCRSLLRLQILLESH
jgi:hypothetical protein